MHINTENMTMSTKDLALWEFRQIRERCNSNYSKSSMAWGFGDTK